MEKITQETVNFTEKNIDRIAALFPSAITETKDADGKLKRAVNFDQLKQLLSDEVADGDECYEFTWVGKKQSIIEGNRPIRKTLRPCKEESKNWDSTENLYIEGDNLEVLKLLQNSYLNKVKMIYIDPPYNTGNDFVYRDNFKVSKEDYEDELGLFDEEDNRLFKNTETNGRYHSDWCSMMYPRLQLARNLLTDDGVIFISIDDNEVHNLRKICDEVFGDINFVMQFPWQSRQSIQNDTDISNNHEYIITYAKKRRLENRRLKETNVEKWHEKDSFVFLPIDIDKDSFDNPDNDPRGLWKADPFDAPNIRPNLTYVIKNPNTGDEFLPPNGRHWRTEEKTFFKYLEDNRIMFGKSGNSKPQLKVFYEEKKMFGSIDNSWWTAERFGTSTQGTKELIQIFNGFSPFDTPKPTRLLFKILKMVSSPNSDDIILDFFSGSATTAHAVMQLNAEDGGNRKFIMVQLPEETDPKSEAYKAGYKNICEIGKERIRRAGKKIEEELKVKSKEGDLFKDEEHKTPDTGFRVLKMDSTNMKDVYYSPSQYNQQMLLDLESNIKDDRTDIDLLYGVLLDWGVPLSLPHKTEKIDGKDVHFVNDTDLVACFEEQVPEEVIREIARRKPLRVVFRDSSFRNSPDKINVTEIFKTLSPETTIKVI
jgi:adenine-specific DNA-methyltransferase